MAEDFAVALKVSALTSQAERQLSGFAASVRRDFGGLASAFGGAGGIGSLAGGLGMVANAAQQVGATIGRAFSSAIDLIRSAGEHVWQLGQRLLGIGKWAAVGVAAGAGYVAKTGIQAAMQVEGFIAKLETALKSTSLAKAYYAWAQQFADVTPFDTPEVVDATVRLQMYGLEATKWLPLVGDMAGAMGKRVTDAVEAVADAVSGGGLERLKEFGISSSTLLQYGAAKGAVGTVSYTQPGDIDKLKSSLEALMTERFGGGMARFAQTGAAAWSNFTSMIWKVKAAIGQALMPAFKDAVAMGQRMLESFVAMGGPAMVADRLAGAWQWFLRTVTSVWQSGVLQRIWDSLAKIGRAIAYAFSGSGLGNGNFIQSLLNAVATGLEWVIGKVPYAIAAFAWLKDAAKYAFGQMLEAMPTLLEGFGKLTAGIIKAFAAMVPALANGFAVILMNWTTLIAGMIDALRLIPGMRAILGKTTGGTVRQAGYAGATEMAYHSWDAAAQISGAGAQVEASTRAAADWWRKSVPAMNAPAPAPWSQYLQGAQQWWGQATAPQGQTLVAGAGAGVPGMAWGGYGQIPATYKTQQQLADEQARQDALDAQRYRDQQATLREIEYNTRQSAMRRRQYD